MTAQAIKAGVAFPFSNSIKGVLGNKTRRDSIRTSLQLILTTPKGSIVYNPKLGSQVPYLVFDLMEEDLENLIVYYTVHDLEEQDPRIKVTSVSIAEGDRKLTIWVGYQDRNDESERQEQAPINFPQQGG